MSTPLVTIRCLVYNHEPYLRQCLDGFVMQKTDFPFEAIVHDDASTDRSADIIREYAEKYPDIIKPIFEKENQYSKHDGSIQRVMNEHTRGKYVALCEGDDYWIDPLKLQKQVYFLERNPDYGLIHSYAKIYDEKKGDYDSNLIGSSFIDVDQEIIGNHIVTLTACFKSEYYKMYYESIPINSSWKMGDYPLWIYIIMNSKSHFMNEVTGVYRILEKSASHSDRLHDEVDFRLSACDISIFFANMYKREYLLDRIKRRTLNIIIAQYLKHNKRLDKYFWNIVKRYRFLSIKIIGAAFIMQFRFGRKLLCKKYL